MSAPPETVGPQPVVYGFGVRHCDNCGRDVMLMGGPGRWHHVRNGLKVLLPADHKVLTCLDCGETYTTTKEAEDIEAMAYLMLGLK